MIRHHEFFSFQYDYVWRGDAIFKAHTLGSQWSISHIDPWFYTCNLLLVSDELFGLRFFFFLVNVSGLDRNGILSLPNVHFELLTPAPPRTSTGTLSSQRKKKSTQTFHFKIRFNQVADRIFVTTEGSRIRSLICLYVRIKGGGVLHIFAAKVQFLPNQLTNVLHLAVH